MNKMYELGFASIKYDERSKKSFINKIYTRLMWCF